MKNPVKINLLAFAKFQLVMGGIVGLICGILYAFGGFAIDTLVSLGWITSSETPGLSYGTLLAFGALIGMPLIFAVAGFLVGFMEAIIYNVLIKWLERVPVNFELK